MGIERAGLAIEMGYSRKGSDRRRQRDSQIRVKLNE